MNAIKLIIYTFNSYKISRVCLHHTAVQLSIPPLVHREEGFNEIVSRILLEPNEPNENYPPLKSWGHRGPQITVRFFVRVPPSQHPESLRNWTRKMPHLEPGRLKSQGSLTAVSEPKRQTDSSPRVCGGLRAPKTVEAGKKERESTLEGWERHVWGYCKFTC